ncbi:hypothetical protein CALVIDRAFT_540176 [Calocera viscosa TUFC12733]|uniref:GST N-terminal domain-containing protein n=1 Tax=Calocera viscosa (strain TUFC12733) TaxID=1330018 RepID=A0A167J2N7_CALVF|nr:hypothetical protein CALVIDRAFT_540176 [Calocera viscosa TUFC12733]
MSTSALAAPAPAATTEDEIIFYDLLCAAPGECWSPHCWKTRMALQYKGVRFRTVWVSYPDIKSVVGHTQPGKDAPTLPVIQHGSTWVADSWQIVQYLEAHFPSPPLLLPSIQSTHFFMCYCDYVLNPAMWQWIVPRVPAFLDERGGEYFVRTREAMLGISLEEAGRGQTIYSLRAPLAPVAKNLKEYGPYIAGKQISYMDIILLGMLQWIDRAEHAAVHTILGMHKSDVGEPIREWYDRVKHLTVAQPEPAESASGR